MIAPKTPAKPSLRQQIRTLEQINAMYERGNAKQAEAMDKMAENMTHLICRLEGLRMKFGISVEEVNVIGEEYIAKMSAAQEMKAAQAANIKVLEINGVEFRPAQKPDIAPLIPPPVDAPSSTPETPVAPMAQAPQD